MTRWIIYWFLLKWMVKPFFSSCNGNHQANVRRFEV